MKQVTATFAQRTLDGGRAIPEGILRAQSGSLPGWVLAAASLVVLWAFGIPAMLSRLLEVGVGLRRLRAVPWVFLMLPVGAIMYRALLLGQLKVPYWRSFLVTATILVLREMSLVRSGLLPDYRYVWTLLLFYSAFVAFTNVGTDLATQRFLRRAAIWSISAIIPIVVVGILLGLDLQIGAGTGRELSNDLATVVGLHANGTSFAAASVVLFILTRALREQRLRSIDWILIGGLTGKPGPAT